MKASKLLREARQLIEREENWCQGADWKVVMDGPSATRTVTRDDPPDQYCALGALEWVADGIPEPHQHTVCISAMDHLERSAHKLRAQMFPFTLAAGYLSGPDGTTNTMSLNDGADFHNLQRKNRARSSHKAILRAYDNAIQQAELEGA